MQKQFYRQIGTLFIPIVIQNLLSAAVNSADVVMLNYVGQSAISAVSLAAQYAQMLFMFFYGLGTGASILCAQYFGKGEWEPIRAVEGIAMRISLTASILFAGAAVTIPELMMKLFTEDAELIRLGAEYLRIVSVAYLCWGVIEVYLSILRSVGKAVVTMSMNVLAFSLNIILNAVFIFGLFGAPKLGVAGVAIATSVSRLAELAACIIVSGRTKEIKLNPAYMLLRNKLLFGDFVKLAVPALLNDVLWGAAFSMYSVILGHLGTDAVAANSLVTVVRNFGTVFCFGVASAGGILVGNVLGENKIEKAKDYTSWVIKLTILTGIVGGLVVLAITPFVMRFADLSETAMEYLRVMLIINSYYVIGIAVNTTLIVGIFRAGGDSRFGCICDGITMWCYAVPLGFFAAFVLKLPVMWVYFLLCTDEFAKWPAVIRRYRSGKWLKNITRDNLFEET
jgi:putative MATE family efflux protein